MRTGVIAKKIGMTRLFQDKGRHVPVTVLEVACTVVGQKNKEKNGYTALQIGFGQAKEKHVNKPQLGFFKAQNLAPAAKIKEFRVSEDALVDVGAILSVEHFVISQMVDITGISSGKGFAGGMKRHNFGGLRASHGVSVSHRSHGSTGNRQDPGRVFKGKKMAGHMGARQVTTQNLKVVATDVERGLLFIHGAVPGHKGALVTVRDAIKHKRIAEAPFPAGIKA